MSTHDLVPTTSTNVIPFPRAAVWYQNTAKRLITGPVPKLGSAWSELPDRAKHTWEMAGDFDPYIDLFSDGKDLEVTESGQFLGIMAETVKNFPLGHVFNFSFFGRRYDAVYNRVYFPANDRVYYALESLNFPRQISGGPLIWNWDFISYDVSHVADCLRYSPTGERVRGPSVAEVRSYVWIDGITPAQPDVWVDKRELDYGYIRRGNSMLYYPAASQEFRLY